jgi:prepilin signal peptidase PulO-like enzyme (type II secretory pathway)
MTLLLAFIVGSTFGSFLNVLIDRLSTGRPFVKGRSYCEHCKKTLKSRDLIPLISYLLLRGKCRFCKAKIPPRLFVVELIVGLLFVGIALQVMSTSLLLLPAVLLTIILLSFIGIFFADIVYGIIPDMLVFISIIASTLFVFVSKQPIQNHLFAGLGSLVFFFLLFAITRGRGMGFGDVKLSFVLGLLLGFPMIIVALYIAFLTGAAISIILVIWRKIRFFGGTIPFGPFLIGGTVITLFFGKIILSEFLTRFF